MVPLLLVLVGLQLQLVCSQAPITTFESQLPSGCVGTNCAYSLLIQASETRLFFHLQGTASGWLGVGFSADQWMSGSDAILCFEDANDQPIIQDVVIPGYSSAIVRSSQAALSDLSMSKSGSSRTYSFSRTLNFENHNVDLTQPIYLFLDVFSSNQPAAAGESFTSAHKHTNNKRVTSGKVCVTVQCQLTTTSTPVSTTTSTLLSTTTSTPLSTTTSTPVSPTTSTLLSTTTSTPLSTTTSTPVSPTTSTPLSTTPSTPEPTPVTFEHRLPSTCTLTDCQYYLRVRQDGVDHLQVMVGGTATGWVGVGFSQDTFMPSMDAVLCSVKDGAAIIQDVTTSGYLGADIDTYQGIDSATLELTGDFRLFQFRRSVAATGSNIDLQQTVFLIIDLFGPVAPEPGQPFRSAHKHTFNKRVSDTKVCLLSTGGCAQTSTLQTSTSTSTTTPKPTSPSTSTQSSTPTVNVGSVSIAATTSFTSTLSTSLSPDTVTMQPPSVSTTATSSVSRSSSTWAVTYEERWPLSCEDSSCQYLLQVRPLSESQIEIKLGSTAAWVGLGFSNSQYMSDTDAVLCFVHNGIAVVQDATTDGYAGATIDSNQAAISDVAVQVTGSFSLFSFTRSVAATAIGQLALDQPVYVIDRLFGNTAPAPGADFLQAHKHTTATRSSASKRCLSALHCTGLTSTPATLSISSTTTSATESSTTSARCNIKLNDGTTMAFPSCSDLNMGSGDALRLFWELKSSIGVLDMALVGAAASDEWISFGFGDSIGDMVGANVVVGWAQGAEEYSLGGKSASQVVLAQNSKIGLQSAEAFWSNGILTLTFRRQVEDTAAATRFNIIWASGRVSSSRRRAITLSAHNSQRRDSGVLDVAAGSLQLARNREREQKRNAHAWLMAISWGVVLPIGACLPRFLHSQDPLWFKLHRALQIFGVALAFVGFALALTLDGHQNEKHHRNLGISIQVAAVLMVLLGIFRPNKKDILRKVWQGVHSWLGRGAIVVAIVNIFFGFALLKPATHWRILYITVLTTMVVVMVILEIRRHNRSRHQIKSKLTCPNQDVHEAKEVKEAIISSLGLANALYDEFQNDKQQEYMELN